MSNGISCFIDIDTFGDKKKIFSNKITVDMLSNIFYHGYKYFSDDNIHTLIFKDKYKEFDNVFVCIFIATLLQNTKIRYNYGRQVRLKRLGTERIALPIDSAEIRIGNLWRSTLNHYRTALIYKNKTSGNTNYATRLTPFIRPILNYDFSPSGAMGYNSRQKYVTSSFVIGD